VICALLTLVLATGTAFAVPKTDVVTLPNGDRVTCEIKGMAYGKLTAKTADMGTIAIKWDKIESIRSDYWFRLRTRDGRLLYGQIRDTEWPRTVRVVFGERETVVPLADVVEIVPIRKEFWDKFNISIAAGYNWTQANRQGRANFDLGLGYGGRIWAWGLNTSFIFSEVEDRDPYRRLDSTLFLQRVISGRWFGLASGNAQRNDELGLVLRVTGALSVGYYLIQSTHHELQLTGGISQNREWAAADDLSEDSLEAPIRLQYKVFRYDSPKTDVLVRGGYMPNLTQKGRYRFDADIAARQEIVADLFVELRYYVNFDSRPPPGALSRQDRGVTFAVGWSK
jgi:hypothetical protein